MLQLSGLTKRFGAVAAVDEVGLTVSQGELVVLAGPSGCGKTTTLRLIAGLETPDRGTVSIDDRDVTNASPREREVAMCFQEGALYPHLSARENIAFPLRSVRRERSEIDRRVDEAAARLNLDGVLLKRRPDEISGGERSRVALARAIVRQPKLFLLDEPFASLDGELRWRLATEFKQLQRELGVATLMVTHQDDEAALLGDRIAVMRGGRIVQTDAPEALYRAPANLSAAQFFGSPPVGRLAGTIEQTASGPRLRLLAGEGSPPSEMLASLGGASSVTVTVRADAWRLGIAEVGSLHVSGVVQFTSAWRGRRLIVWRTRAGSTLYAVADERLDEGAAVSFSAPWATVHFFPSEPT